ncbi:MAG: transcription termination/antitermination protein NusA [Candidatus Paracaedibacteraceae bacterium]|nr:transcription termination/antitermination protein NusA [Candidatus Paracaedibacteraceae bacterium]
MKPELIQVIDAVAQEKGLNAEEIYAAVEEAIRKAARVKYGIEYDIDAKVNRLTAEIDLFLCHTVVNEVLDPYTEISLDEAKNKKPEAEVGMVLREQLPPMNLGRVTAQTAKQVIYNKVREAERMKQFEEFKDKMHQVVSGVVKRADFTGVVVDLNKIEAFLRRDEMIPRESFRPGDRIRAYVLDIRNDHRGMQVLLSRTHPMFLAKLFAQEVPEIYDGVIEIKGVARDPGSRAKISVYTHDPSIDPVGSCVGVRGSRVQSVVDELQGEKIDVITWSSNPATTIVNALAPAEVERVVLDEENLRIEVIVPDDQLSMAIGRRGQNVRLASMLTGWQIEVMTASDAEAKRAEHYKKLSQAFIDALDVDSVIAHLLVGEGFENVREVAEIDLGELKAIEGFDEDIAQELQNRASQFVSQQEANFKKEYTALGGSEELVLFLPELELNDFIALVKNEIKTIDDFAGLASDELLEILPNPITERKASDLIMRARKLWFKDDVVTSS